MFQHHLWFLKRSEKDKWVQPVRNANQTWEDDEANNIKPYRREVLLDKFRGNLMLGAGS